MMTAKKLLDDSQTLHRFIQVHCDKEHNDVAKQNGALCVLFQEEALCELPYTLCEECEVLLKYGYDRLAACKQEPKPSCRKCPNPCYERPMWKKMAKIMRYSGMYLGLTKVRKFFFK